MYLIFIFIQTSLGSHKLTKSTKTSILSSFVIVPHFFSSWIESLCSTGVKENTEIAPYFEVHVEMYTVVRRCIARRFADHVFRLCLENAPDVVVPWSVHPRRPGADLNSERINNQRVYRTFRFVNHEPTPEKGVFISAWAAIPIAILRWTIVPRSHAGRRVGIVVPTVMLN